MKMVEHEHELVYFQKPCYKSVVLWDTEGPLKRYNHSRNALKELLGSILALSISFLSEGRNIVLTYSIFKRRFYHYDLHHTVLVSPVY